MGSPICVKHWAILDFCFWSRYFRARLIFKLINVKRAPVKPPMTPKTSAGMKAKMFTLIAESIWNKKIHPVSRMCIYNVYIWGVTLLENKSGISINILQKHAIVVKQSKLTWNMMYWSVLNIPNCHWYLNAVKAELKRSVVKVEVIAQKNICQESFKFQKDETSSMEKRRPPTGAPNAEATPAAAPALMKLRLELQVKTKRIDWKNRFKIIGQWFNYYLSSELRNRSKYGRLRRNELDLNWLKPAPTKLLKHTQNS